MDISPRIHHSWMQCAPIAPSALARDRSNRVRISVWVATRSGRALGKDLRSAISNSEDRNRNSPIVNLVKDAVAIQTDPAPNLTRIEGVEILRIIGEGRPDPRGLQWVRDQALRISVRISGPPSDLADAGVHQLIHARDISHRS
jgi:hypothetical protein